MVVEVGTRWIAYGKVSQHSWLRRTSNVQALTLQKYPMTPLNVIDLLLVMFCSITLIVVFTSPCSDNSICRSESAKSFLRKLTSQAEENLDMILLVIRNGVQFLRIVNILRR
jgi:hypothetical protein